MFRPFFYYHFCFSFFQNKIKLGQMEKGGADVLTTSLVIVMLKVSTNQIPNNINSVEKKETK